MSKWLLKTESNVYSIEDLKRDKRTLWHGVRNYQARNFLRQMRLGDKVLIYHSVVDPTGIFGLAEVSKIAAPDPSQFDKKSEYFDEKASIANPRWFAPEIKWLESFNPPLLREDLKKEKMLSRMMLFQKGSRLSVQPVTEVEYRHIIKLR